MDYRQRLRDCRTCAEAGPILEALKVRPTQRKLIETAIQLNQSRDPRQQSYGEDFFITAFREMEDEHKNNNDKKMEEANGGLHRDQGGEADVEKAIVKGEKHQEADEITGELDSHQSSDLDMPYKQEGTDAPQPDIESMQSASGENQMGGIKENLPGMMPMGNGMPGNGNGMPPIAPDIQQQMAPQMPKMPPMNPQQQMRQMQYTVDYNNKRYFNPIVRELKKIREAYIALDKKVQESQSQAGTMKLDIEKVRRNSPVHERGRLRETIAGTNIEVPETRFLRHELENKRMEIAQLDRELTKNRPAPYQ